MDRLGWFSLRHGGRSGSFAASGKRSPRADCCLAAVGRRDRATLPVACFGTLTDWSLAETANVSQVGWLILIRAAFVTAVFLPLGFAWGVLVGLGGGNAARQTATRSLPTLLAGFLVARWL